MPTIAEVQAFATRSLWTYNHERHNMGLGAIIPKQKLALEAQALLLSAARNGGITGCATLLSICQCADGITASWDRVVLPI